MPDEKRRMRGTVPDDNQMSIRVPTEVEMHDFANVVLNAKLTILCAWA